MWNARITPVVPLGLRPVRARPFDADRNALSIRLNTSCHSHLIGPAVGSNWQIPWPALSVATHTQPKSRGALYTAEQRARRDASPWTLVQGILAPAQFAIFLISLGLVVWFLATGDGFAWATASIVAKTLALYAIMITGSIWEREVFGRYLFADAFFWEDVVSMLVLALHTLYLATLVSGAVGHREQMLIALAAYATYVINATQFLLKLRAARREGNCASPRVPLSEGCAP